MSESNEQVLLVEWFRLQYPDKTIMAIPNGAWLSGDARRRAILMNKMKREGLVVGASDLFVPHMINGHGGLFVELKDAKKTFCSVTKEQRIFLETMNSNGYVADWASGFDRAKKLIEDYMYGDI